MSYKVLWALIVGLHRQAVKLQQSIHTITESKLSNTLLLMIAGLLFVANPTKLSAIEDGFDAVIECVRRRGLSLWAHYTFRVSSGFDTHRLNRRETRGLKT